jgi:hypothetical protein
MPTITLSLSDEDIERIAKRVAEELKIIAGKPRPEPQNLPSGDNRLQVSRVEAARLLGYKNPATIDRLRARGLHHPNLATRRPMYPIKELERFIKECCHSAKL